MVLIQEASRQQTVNRNQADLLYFHSDKIHRTLMDILLASLILLVEDFAWEEELPVINRDLIVVLIKLDWIRVTLFFQPTMKFHPVKHYKSKCFLIAEIILISFRILVILTTTQDNKHFWKIKNFLLLKVPSMINMLAQLLIQGIFEIHP